MPPRPKLDVDRIRYLLDQGMRQAAVARRLGVTQAAVCTAAKGRRMSDYYSTDVTRLPLFQKPAARTTDPATSHAAAAAFKGVAEDHRRRILEALRSGPAGQTEIARRAGLATHQAGKRLGEMGRAGLIETTGRELVNATGRREREWRRATDGR